MAINRNNLYLHLIEKQFNILELTTQDALLYNWREWTITQKQADKFEKYAIALIKKTLKCNKTKAGIAFSRFIADHGLLIKN